MKVIKVFTKKGGKHTPKDNKNVKTKSIIIATSNRDWESERVRDTQIKREGERDISIK